MLIGTNEDTLGSLNHIHHTMSRGDIVFCTEVLYIHVYTVEPSFKTDSLNSTLY